MNILGEIVMKMYLSKDELDELYGKWLNDLYDSISDDTNIIYEQFFCETKKELRAMLSPKQRKLFDILEQHREIYETALVEDAFGFGYCLGMKEFMES
jgi:hypothetical protein